MQNKNISFNPPMANALILYPPPSPPPLKHQKSNDFLVLSGGIKWEHNSEMGWTDCVFEESSLGDAITRVQKIIQSVKSNPESKQNR